MYVCIVFFFFNDTATTEIYTLSLHDALPIFSNEKYRGIRLRLQDGLIQAQANNPEMEEAEEEIEVQYTGAKLEIGFNVSYLLDALNVINTPNVTLALGDANSSCVMRAEGQTECTYVIMPMRL